MIKMQITVPQWLELPLEIRHKMAKIFEIPKSTGAQIMDNRVLSDGHTNEDLGKLTVEKMQAFSGSSETDYWKLFESSLQKILDGDKPQEQSIPEQSTAPKKRGRPKKNV